MIGCKRSKLLVMCLKAVFGCPKPAVGSTKSVKIHLNSVLLHGIKIFTSSRHHEGIFLLLTRPMNDQDRSSYTPSRAAIMTNYAITLWWLPPQYYNYTTVLTGVTLHSGSIAKICVPLSRYIHCFNQLQP